MNIQSNTKELEKEVAGLRLQLEEALDAIDAIRNQQVDALILKDDAGHQLYTLNSADQTYRVFIEKMNEGAVTLNSEGLILYSNTRFASMVAMPLNEVIGAMFIDFIETESKKYFKELFIHSWRQESKGEITLLGKNNTPVPILISAATIGIQDGTALGIIITELTFQKETERQLEGKNKTLTHTQNSLAALNNSLEQRVLLRTQELLASIEHFKFLADNIPVILCTATADGEIDYFNEKWYTYSGFTEQESIGHGWQKIVHPDDVNTLIIALKEALQFGKEYSVECRLLRASDGLFRHHSVTGKPFRNEEGIIVKWFGTSTDTEDQKLALSRKDDFISMASHELKTPVTILKAYVQLLPDVLQKQDNASAGDFIEKMNKQIARLNRLITDLLDATRLNTKELTYDNKVFDFSELIKEITDQVQLTAGSHNIETDLQPGIMILADRSRIAQVVNNLLGNAIKYSPDAHKILIYNSTENGIANLYVQDFGIGVPLKQQAKLFTRFFRASEVKSNTFPGLGLGLYISNEIVSHYNGHLSFTSEEGKGSVFRMELPLSKQDLHLEQY